MTTTELIELLKKHERGGATGRPREVMFEVDDRIIDTDGIEVTGSGDGLISELYLSLPSAQPEQIARDIATIIENEKDMRVMLKNAEHTETHDFGVCDYCHEDSDGYVKPIEKNGHAFIRFGMNGWELSMKANGWHGSTKIRYCPMCGRRLER